MFLLQHMANTAALDVANDFINQDIRIRGRLSYKWYKQKRFEIDTLDFQKHVQLMQETPFGWRAFTAASQKELGRSTIPAAVTSKSLVCGGSTMTHNYKSTGHWVLHLSSVGEKQQSNPQGISP